tara:strand:- start:659 stop:1063 length:405 start_codon:yes stop_codon:yes gene_type:complete
MAAYGRGDYGGGAYSYGAYLGALAIVSASTVAVSGDKIKDAQFEISSTSTISVGAVKISSASFAVDDTSVMTVAGGLDAVGSVNIVSTSILNIEYNRIVHFQAIIIDNSSVVINARKKWETEADVSEIWTTVSV